MLTETYEMPRTINKRSISQHRQDSRGWTTALAHYRRLCDASVVGEEAAAYNAIGAVRILREALPTSKARQDILLILCAVNDVAVSSLDVMQEMRYRYRHNSSMILTWLSHEGMVKRQKRLLPAGGQEYLYRLSPLGRMVIHHEETLC